MTSRHSMSGWIGYSTWHRDGVLCIGDAAHAMSPVGGVGINLAITGAVAAARLLAATAANAPYHQQAPEPRCNAAAHLPTVVTQGLQRILHRRLLAPVMRGKQATPRAAMLKLLQREPELAVVPAYLIGVGLHREHAPGFARRGSEPQGAQQLPSSEGDLP